jgi:hypothetical protein
MIDELINSYDEFFKKIYNNKSLTLLIVIILALYISMQGVSSAHYTSKLLSNIWVKILLFIFISYTASSNPVLAIMLTIVLLITLQNIADKKLRSEIKKLEQFDPDMSRENTLNNNINSYLTNPLQRESKKVDCDGNIPDLSLKNLNSYNLQMINEGNNIYKRAKELDNVFSEQHDNQSNRIKSNNMKANAKFLVDSGINRLQYSPNGAFNIGELPPPPLDRYLNFMMTFDDANIPREIYGVLVQSYEDLVNMTVGDNSTFYEKAKNMYDIELKLLLNIYQFRYNLFTPDKVKEINAQIHQVNKASVNKDINYFMQIQKLSTLLL